MGAVDLQSIEMDNLIGQQFGQYRLSTLLGKGGMGVVYQGIDINLNRQVAIKVMHDKLARRRSYRQQFLQEAQAAARLDHPHIVPIYHFGAHEQYLYMVMGLVPGGSLGTYIRSIAVSGHVIELTESLALMAQVAEGLDHAHSQGIVHRDVKPDNILLRPLETPDRSNDPPIRALISDFGLARVAVDDLTLGTAALMGTLPYLSPEQCRGDEIDGRADLYALSVVLYQLVTGQLPFRFETPAEAVAHHLSTPPPSLRRKGREVPTAVVSIIEKGLAKQPNSRFKNGLEMATLLRAACHDLSTREIFNYHHRGQVFNLSDPIRHHDTVIRHSPHPNTLLIREKNGRSFYFQLQGETVLLGRSRSCDVILPGSGVSREHAQLRRQGSGWLLTDLASTNGTFLAGQQLRSHMPEYWIPGQVVRIGNISLQWQANTPADPLAEETNPIDFHPERGLEETSHPQKWPNRRVPDLIESGITSIARPLLLRPSEINIEPGQRVGVQLHFFNQSSSPRHVHYAIKGVPESWFTTVENERLVNGHSEGHMTFVLHPPRHVSARAGNYKISLIAHIKGPPDSKIETKQSEISGTVNLKTFSAFNINLSQSTMRHGKSGQIILKNEGNEIIHLTVSGHDPEEVLSFEVYADRMPLEPGQETLLPIRISDCRRPWLGRRQKKRFVLQTTNQETVRKAEGVLIVPPRLPLWLLFVIFSLLTVLTIALMMEQGSLIDLF